jgi:hypothetical protein
VSGALADTAEWQKAFPVDTSKDSNVEFSDGTLETSDARGTS